MLLFSCWEVGLLGVGEEVGGARGSVVGGEVRVVDAVGVVVGSGTEGDGVWAAWCCGAGEGVGEGRCCGFAGAGAADEGVVVTVTLPGAGSAANAFRSFSFARRSRSRASFCALVMTVILIFFISPASLSMSSPALSADGDPAAAPVGGGCCAGPLAVAAFLVPLGARGTGSFFAGARVFLTLRVLLPLDAATLTDDSGRLATSGLGRIETAREVGGTESKPSDETMVDAALRRREARDIFPGAGSRTAVPATVLRLLLRSMSSSTCGGFAFRSRSPIRVEGRSSGAVATTDADCAWRSRRALVASALSSSAVQLVVCRAVGMSSLLSSQVATVHGTSGAGGASKKSLGTLLVAESPDMLRRFFKPTALACDACVGDE